MWVCLLQPTCRNKKTWGYFRAKSGYPLCRKWKSVDPWKTLKRELGKTSLEGRDLGRFAESGRRSLWCVGSPGRWVSREKVDVAKIVRQLRGDIIYRRTVWKMIDLFITKNVLGIGWANKATGVLNPRNYPTDVDKDLADTWEHLVGSVISVDVSINCHLPWWNQ